MWICVCVCVCVCVCMHMQVCVYYFEKESEGCILWRVCSWAEDTHFQQGLFSGIRICHKAGVWKVENRSKDCGEGSLWSKTPHCPFIGMCLLPRAWFTLTDLTRLAYKSDTSGLIHFGRHCPVATTQMPFLPDHLLGISLCGKVNYSVNCRLLGYWAPRQSTV
jgi:hypothetical protein